MEQENKQELNSQAVKLPQPAESVGEGGYPFRGATFGGFQRQDVLDYLKKSQEANRQKLLSMQEALASAQTQWEAERQRTQESEQAREDAMRIVAERNGQLDRVREALSEAQGELEQRRSENAALQAQVARMQEEQATLRSQAESYMRLRERAVTIELDAHARAQGIIDQAALEGARVRKEYIKWAQEMNAEYQELRENIKLTFGKASQELARVCRMLENMNGELNLREDEMQSLLEQLELSEPESAEPTT